MDAEGVPLAAALEWARREVPVLPVRPAEKAPLTVHSVSDASTETNLVRAWWARWPEANVAIATGGRGVDVLDVDVRDAGSGWAALNRLRQAGLVDDGMPSGGVHLYFFGTDQGNGSLHRERVDFLSSGGCVLVPPSRVVTDSYAGVYRWERRAAPTARLDWQAVRELLRPPAAVIPRHRRGESGRPDRDPAALVWATAELLNQLLEAAARTSAVRTPAHSDRPDGWVIPWGKHLRPLTVTHGLLGAEVTEQHVACYLAKYATMAPNPPDTSPPRLIDSTIRLYVDPARHHGRLISGAWSFDRPTPGQAWAQLRPWAHMLGFHHERRNDMQDHGRMLSVEQAAELLGTSPRFVRRLIAERRIAFVRYGSPGAPVRIAESDVRRFLQAGRVEAVGRVPTGAHPGVA